MITTVLHSRAAPSLWILHFSLFVSTYQVVHLPVSWCMVMCAPGGILASMHRTIWWLCNPNWVKMGSNWFFQLFHCGVWYTVDKMSSLNLKTILLIPKRSWAARVNVTLPRWFWLSSDHCKWGKADTRRCSGKKIDVQFATWAHHLGFVSVSSELWLIDKGDCGYHSTVGCSLSASDKQGKVQVGDGVTYVWGGVAGSDALDSNDCGVELVVVVDDVVNVVGGKIGASIGINWRSSGLVMGHLARSGDWLFFKRTASNCGVGLLMRNLPMETVGRVRNVLIEMLWRLKKMTIGKEYDNAYQLKYRMKRRRLLC